MGFAKAHEKSAYQALLGPDGRVRWLHRGGVDDESMVALRIALAGPNGPAAAP